MTYEKAKRAYDEKFEGSVALRCSVCQSETHRDILSIFGVRCKKCFNDYCAAAPRYQIRKDYPNDPLAWAKRIIDKQKQGEQVSIYAAKLARDALGAKHDL